MIFVNHLTIWGRETFAWLKQLKQKLANFRGTFLFTAKVHNSVHICKNCKNSAKFIWIISARYSGSPILFPWHVNKHFLLCVKREWGFTFSMIRKSIFFRPQESGFRCSHDPWIMHLLTRDLWTNDFCGDNFSLLLEILASLKLVNYTKLDVKTAHSTRLQLEDWELTRVTVNQEGLESSLSRCVRHGISMH